MSIVDSNQPRMAQCSITGKMVPEDELVTIQGQQVCAEGKAILLERLKSGEALPGEKEKPTALRRFSCIFVDGLILGVPFAVINAVIGHTPGAYFDLGLVAILSTSIQIIYFGQMHASGGQTLGKKAGKLVVVNLDGSPISGGTAYLRAAAYAGPNYLSAIALLVGAQPLVGLAGLLVGVWGISDVIFALVDRTRQRSLHDRIAGTRVVEKEST